MSAFLQTQKRLAELRSGSLGRLLVKYSWPALVAMSLNAFYAVVDRIFIGQGCGVDAMAGITLAMPLTMLFGAFGVFIGAGHSAILSIKLGANDRVACEKLLGQLVAFKILLFLTLTPLVCFNLDTILGWCGASRVTPGAYAAAKEYLHIVLFAYIFSHMSFGLSAMQRAEGGAFRSMLCMIVGFGTNLILDPILIFGFNMGVAGAAWATNISMFCACAWALQYYLRGVTVVRLRWGRIGFHKGLILRPFGIGFSPFFQQILGAIITVSLQIAFTKWMTDEASRTAQIASLGVYQACLILIMQPILGTQQGLQPIIGYNWGARNFRRVGETLSLGLKATAVLTIIAFVIQVVPPFPTWLARMFISGDHPELIALAAHDLQVSNSLIWCIFINIVATTYFQSIGRPGAAVWLSLLRQGFCLLPVIWFLPYFMADKPFAIWLSMPISDIVANVVSIVPLALHMRFLRRVRPREDFKNT